uniref:Uncharacterized protein n=1 Tax=Siphoviridae sp. ctB3v5 TaxID=2826186 RepID=A0A8S5M901_9CAUD|nr:MAG TPA: hypothetical protein [Siphoviridae sp. ctB3v5]
MGRISFYRHFQQFFRQILCILLLDKYPVIGYNRATR